jgi:hypothetical protein
LQNTLNSKEFFSRKAVCGLGHVPSQTAFLLFDLSFHTHSPSTSLPVFRRFSIHPSFNHFFRLHRGRIPSDMRIKYAH